MNTPRLVLTPEGRHKFLREFNFQSLHQAWDTWGKARTQLWLERHYMTPRWLELVQ